MNEITPMEEALALALRLPLSERLQLIERVAASVSYDIAHPHPDDDADSEQHWGRNLVQMVREMDFSDWDDIDSDDPVEWVRRVRQDQATRRGLDWGTDE